MYEIAKKISNHALLDQLMHLLPPEGQKEMQDRIDLALYLQS